LPRAVRRDSTHKSRVAMPDGMHRHIWEASDASHFQTVPGKKFDQRTQQQVKEKIGANRLKLSTSATVTSSKCVQCVHRHEGINQIKMCMTSVLPAGHHM
jgi:hypothetical protein